ncbi:MAG: hypothetical protein V1911_02780, partial [Candidatus Micrarchaeota archaeon]
PTSTEYSELGPCTGEESEGKCMCADASAAGAPTFTVKIKNRCEGVTYTVASAGETDYNDVTTVLKDGTSGLVFDFHSEGTNYAKVPVTVKITEKKGTGASARTYPRSMELSFYPYPKPEDISGEVLLLPPIEQSYTSGTVDCANRYCNMAQLFIWLESLPEDVYTDIGAKLVEQGQLSSPEDVASVMQDVTGFSVIHSGNPPNEGDDCSDPNNPCYYYSSDYVTPAGYAAIVSYDKIADPVSAVYYHYLGSFEQGPFTMDGSNFALNMPVIDTSANGAPGLAHSDLLPYLGLKIDNAGIANSLIKSKLKSAIATMWGLDDSAGVEVSGAVHTIYVKVCSTDDIEAAEDAAGDICRKYGEQTGFYEDEINLPSAAMFADSINVIIAGTSEDQILMLIDAFKAQAEDPADTRSLIKGTYTSEDGDEYSYATFRPSTVKYFIIEESAKYDSGGVTAEDCKELPEDEDYPEYCSAIDSIKQWYHGVSTYGIDQIKLEEEADPSKRDITIWSCSDIGTCEFSTEEFGAEKAKDILRGKLVANEMVSSGPNILNTVYGIDKFTTPLGGYFSGAGGSSGTGDEYAFGIDLAEVADVMGKQGGHLAAAVYDMCGLVPTTDAGGDAITGFIDTSLAPGETKFIKVTNANSKFIGESSMAAALGTTVLPVMVTTADKGEIKWFDIESMKLIGNKIVTPIWTGEYIVAKDASGKLYIIKHKGAAIGAAVPADSVTECSTGKTGLDDIISSDILNIADTGKSIYYAKTLADLGAANAQSAGPACGMEKVGSSCGPCGGSGDDCASCTEVYYYCNPNDVCIRGTAETGVCTDPQPDTPDDGECYFFKGLRGLCAPCGGNSGASTDYKYYSAGGGLVMTSQNKAVTAGAIYGACYRTPRERADMFWPGSAVLAPGNLVSSPYYEKSKGFSECGKSENALSNKKYYCSNFYECALDPALAGVTLGAGSCCHPGFKTPNTAGTLKIDMCCPSGYKYSNNICTYTGTGATP